MKGKKLFLVIVIIIVAIIVGIFYYNSQPEPEVLPPEEKEEEKETEIKVCGITNSFSSFDINSSPDDYFEKDSVLVCMGQNLINGCIGSRMMLGDFSDEKNILKVTIVNDSVCKLRIDFPEESSTYDEVERDYAGKYVECPVSEIEKGVSMSKDRNEYPGSYMAALMFSIGAIVDEQEAGISDHGCEGSLLDSSE